MATSSGIPGGRPAGQVKKKAKVLVYGEPGSGKTAFALSWPKAVVFDLEGGTDLYAPGLKLHWGAIPPYTVIRTKNPDDLSAPLAGCATTPGRATRPSSSTPSPSCG